MDATFPLTLSDNTVVVSMGTNCKSQQIPDMIGLVNLLRGWSYVKIARKEIPDSENIHNKFVPVKDV
jgi:hypothetical protein